MNGFIEHISDIANAISSNVQKARKRTNCLVMEQIEMVWDRDAKQTGIWNWSEGKEESEQ